MCPIWPLHLVLLYLLAICPLWVLCQQLPQISAVFNPDSAMIHMNLYEDVNVTVKGVGLLENDEILVTTENAGISFAEINSTSKLTQEDADNGEWHGKIRIYGEFLGRTNIGIRAARNGEISAANETVSVIVTRPERVIDTIFTASIALFVSLIFINFGCAMHWPTVKEVLKKPIGPVIGMVGQFIFMPLMTFGLGFLIFPDNAALHLGMFMTGVAPGGGASNIWTFILGGNLNLSLAMTSISTIFSFGFMPLWIFSLGQVVFANANIGVPYTNVITFVVGLLVPMSIGLAMQRFTPKIAAFMVKILKGFSSTLLIFIIVFAIVTNLYIFQLFTWQIVVAGMGIPWLGYMFGYALARIFKRPHKDALAISIETGIQNTGIAIFLLRYALSQPEADITTVIPVSAAIMTPIPMTAILIYQKIKGCIVARRNRHKKIVEDPVTPVYEVGQPDGITTIDGNLK
ncbi:ileal sodium/bile acid cotransporter-like isoform X1 [Ostrinia nubilalis]|uniref:ileal sodium/bile acid cotransporter-like isoform X1 n=1 Tax=Ostrinia nubilalis TaxID=29057 RepID=UPI00308231F1